jgi:hypothetical protein
MEIRDRKECTYSSLVIDKMTIHDSPVEGPLSITLKLKAGSQSESCSLHTTPSKKKDTEIPIRLQLRRKDETMVFYFNCQIQDMQKRAAKPSTLQSNSDILVPFRGGRKTYSSDSGWRYSIHWHLEE